MQSKRYWMIVGLVALGIVSAGCSAKTTAKVAEKPAILEPVGNTGLKRITLTTKASERLGIQTVPLREEKVTRRRTVGAEVVASSGASADGLWVRVRVHEADLDMIDRAQPVQVYALSAAQAKASQGAAAKPDKGPGGDESSAALYYVLDGKDHGFKVGQPALVDLMLQGGVTTHKLIPYAALIYDTKGVTWVYTSTSAEPLAFVRHKVMVDYIEGDTAYLSEGPAVGTLAVTFGAAELYGAETGVGK